MKWKWPELARRWKEALGKYQFVLLVLAAGILLLLLPTGGPKEEPVEDSCPETRESFDLEQFEEKLARMLSQVEGAGETRVILTLDSGDRRVLARDEERDGEGGPTSTVVTVEGSSGEQGVVPLQTVAPQFRGALVVCPGGGEAKVKLELIRAVSALTGLGADSITVCRGNQ